MPALLPTRAYAGYCAATDYASPAKCQVESTGALQITRLEQCFAACMGCAKCNFMSFSKRNQDCSWYQHCTLDALHPGTEEQNYTTYDLTQGYEQFGKVGARADPWAVADLPRRGAARFNPRPPRIAPVNASRRFEWSAVPRNFADQVDISFLVQYWGASGRPLIFAEKTLAYLEDLAHCGALLALVYFLPLGAHAAASRLALGAASILLASLSPLLAFFLRSRR